MGRWSRVQSPAQPSPQIGQIDLSEAYLAVRQRAASLRRRRIVSSAVAVMVLSSVLSIAGYAYVSSIPLPDAIALPQTTTVYYADGVTVMARLGQQSRTIIDPARLSDRVIEAFVAAEDPAFWSGSATKISRQYARAAAGLDTATAEGRAKSVIMAWKLEDTYPKRQIAGFYLNTIYFGRGCYGIEAASLSYFGHSADQLTLAEAVVLAGVIRSPGDGRFDPSVAPASARSRFRQVTAELVNGGALDKTAADQLSLPTVRPAVDLSGGSRLDRPVGLVVAQVLAELRAHPAMRGRSTDELVNGGFSIVTSIDARAQERVEEAADETRPNSELADQPRNLQAAAVIVQPGTGRVLAYFGGHDGTGADYAGWHLDDNGDPVGYGAHPPGTILHPQVVAAALKAGISVRSRWRSPAERTFPAGESTQSVRDFGAAACRPVCELADALTAGLAVPLFAVAQRLGPTALIDSAAATGVRAMWGPNSAGGLGERVDLVSPAGPASARLDGPQLLLGAMPITVLDQANVMATFASAGQRADAHFVRQVTSRGVTLLTDDDVLTSRRVALEPAQAADLTWALSRNPAGRVADGRPVAVATGVAPLRTSAIEFAHAWAAGYTPDLAVAVWIGNEEIEFPLRDRAGGRVSGSTLPAEILRRVITDVSQGLDLPVRPFAPPVFTGSATGGEA